MMRIVSTSLVLATEACGRSGESRLPSRLADNPLVWMVEVNGFVVDVRMIPRDVQEEAHRLGLIPFVPSS